MKNAALAALLLVAGLLVGRYLYQPAPGEPRAEAPGKSSLTQVAATQPPAIPDLLAQVKPTVALVHMVGVKGAGNGTAFRVGSNGLFATNFHMLNGFREGTLTLADRPPCTISEVIAYDQESDWALIRASDCSGPALIRAPRDGIREGIRLVVLGNPGGNGWAASTGILSKVVEDHGRKWFFHDAATNDGSSGSPVLDEWGHVVGIHVGRLKDSREFRVVTPIFLLPEETALPPGIPMRTFAERHPPQVALDRLNSILKQDEENLPEWLDWIATDKQPPRLPSSSRQAWNTEISGSLCPAAPRLPGAVLSLLQSELRFEEAVRAEAAIKEERSNFAVGVAEKTGRGQKFSFEDCEKAETLFQRLLDRMVETGRAFDEVAEAERAVSAISTRSVVTATGRHSLFSATRRALGAQSRRRSPCEGSPLQRYQ